jgi:hypothetical protein
VSRPPFPTYSSRRGFLFLERTQLIRLPPSSSFLPSLPNPPAPNPRNESSSPPPNDAILSSSTCTRASKPRLESTLSWSTSREETSCSTFKESSLPCDKQSSMRARFCSHSSTSIRRASSIGSSILPYLSIADLGGSIRDKRWLTKDLGWTDTLQRSQARQHPAYRRGSHQGR